MTLYDITVEQQLLLDQLEENGGELTPELEAALALTSEDFDVKAEGYIEAISKYRDIAANAAERIKKFQQAKKTAENIQKRLKERLMFAMQVFGDRSREVGCHKLTVRRSTSVVIEDEHLLPTAYVNITYTPDKAAILAALEGEQDVPGASLQVNESLNIR